VTRNLRPSHRSRLGFVLLSALALASAAVLALAWVAAPAGAGPLEDTLDQVDSTVDSTLPPVSVGGGGLPQIDAGGSNGSLPGVTVGGGGLPQLSVGESPGGGGQPPGGGQSPGGTSGGQGTGPATTSQNAPASSTTQPSSGSARTSPEGSGSAGSTSSPGGGSSDGSPTTAGSAGGGDAAPATGARPAARREPADERSLPRRIFERIPPEYRAITLAVAAIALLFGFISLHQARKSRRAQEDAMTDQLTGLANRNGLEQQLEREWKRASRYGHGLGLLMLDLDGFKEVNDTRGHAAGDRVLREAAAAIAARVRETDFPARLGGDEFVVLCPETEADGLAHVAAGLRDTLASHSIDASVGFAWREPSDQEPADVLRRADEQMYERKRDGRRDAPAAEAVGAAAAAG
jgi:diguanylate cyclase (GGDEF)-like protein